jgi:hypothetical protein
MYYFTDKNKKKKLLSKTKNGKPVAAYYWTKLLSFSMLTMCFLGE